jgi:hypothetical protein
MPPDLAAGAGLLGFEVRDFEAFETCFFGNQRRGFYFTDFLKCLRKIDAVVGKNTGAVGQEYAVFLVRHVYLRLTVQAHFNRDALDTVEVGHLVVGVTGFELGNVDFGWILRECLIRRERKKVREIGNGQPCTHGKWVFSVDNAKTGFHVYS